MTEPSGKGGASRRDSTPTGSDQKGRSIEQILALLATLIIAGSTIWTGISVARLNASSSNRAAETTIAAEDGRFYRREIGALADRLVSQRDAAAQTTIRRLEAFYRTTTDENLRRAVLQILADHVRRRLSRVDSTPETLTANDCKAFTRDAAPVDVQAAIYLFGHRLSADEDVPIDLLYVDLSETNFSLGRYQSMNFGGSSLINANLRGSQFSGSSFNQADMRCVDLAGVDDLTAPELQSARSLRFARNVPNDLLETLRTKLQTDPP